MAYMFGKCEAAKSILTELLPKLDLANSPLYPDAIVLNGMVSEKCGGDYDRAIGLINYVLEVQEHDVETLISMRLLVCKLLDAAHRFKDAVTHGIETCRIARAADVSPRIIINILNQVVFAAGSLCDWQTANDVLGELQALSKIETDFADNVELLGRAVQNNTNLYSKLQAINIDNTTCTVEASTRLDSICTANAKVTANIVDWWQESRSEDILRLYSNDITVFSDDYSLVRSHTKHFAVLYDYWGHGNLARLMLNHQTFPHTLNPIVAVDSVNELRQMIRLFALYVDVIVVLWRGPAWVDGVIAPVPASDNVIGGASYGVIPTRTVCNTERSGEWLPGLKFGGFLPDEVISFLTEEALSLVKQGRLIVIPGHAVGCTNPGHGPFEGLFSKLCSAIPVVSNLTLPPAFPIGFLPYFADVPISAIVDVMQEHSEDLSRLRMLLIKRARESAACRDASAASKSMDLEIADSLKFLHDYHIVLKRTHGWTVSEEAIGNSSYSWSQEELSVAARRQGGATGVWPVGASTRLEEASNWMPLFALQKQGYKWNIVASSESNDESNAREPSTPEAPVGGWLEPPDCGPTFAEFGEKCD